MNKKYEYMLHVFGGAFNEGSPVRHLRGYHYFNTKDKMNELLDKLLPYQHLGLVRDVKEGYLTHKRTIACMDLVYKNKTYHIEYDFGYEYEEESAEFMFFEGNYSCDCNLSSFIQDQCDKDFEELNCGYEIEIENFEIKYLD